MSKVASFIKKRKVLLIVLTIIVIIIAVVVNFISSAATAVTGMLSMPSVTTLSRQNVENVIVATGSTASSETRIVVATGTAGSELIAVNIEVGDSVSNNEILAQLDDETVYDKIESAQESYSDKRTDIAYSDAITDHNLAVSQNSVTDAQTAYTDAKTKYENDQQENANKRAALQTNLTSQTKTVNTQIETLLLSWATADGSIDLSKPELFETELTKAYNLLSSIEQQDDTILTAQTYNSISMLRASLQSISSEIAMLESESEALLNSFSTQETQLLNSIEQAQNSLTTQSLQAQSGDSTNSRTLEDLNESIVDAQAELDDTYIRSPIDGVVTELNYEVGDTLGTSALCTIQNLSDMQIYTTVASYDVVNLTEGMQAVITTDSTGDVELMGTITEISPIAVDASGSFSVEISIDSENENLRVGVPAQVTFILDSSPDTYAVPIDAVVEQDGSSYIYVYDTMPTAEQAALGEDDGRRMIQVATGLEADYLIEIISPELFDGMIVLDDPQGFNVASFSGMDGALMVTGPGAGGGAPAGGGGAGGGR